MNSAPSQGTVVGRRAAFGRLDSRRPSLLGEALVLIGLLVVYDRIRALAPSRVFEAIANGFDFLRVEGPFAVERTFNLWVAAHPRVDALSVGYYQYVHIPAALGVLVWTYIAKPRWYRPIRNALVVTNIAGLIVFVVYPVAPPRLLPGAGFIDLVARAGFGTAHGPLPMNAYGAVPSLHLAWATCVAMVGLSICRRRWTRAVWIMHPVITAIVVVGTGNHYLLDVVAGTALGVGSSLLTGLRWRPRATNRARADGVPEPVSAPRTPQRSYTLVCFHAHPDDETLFTGGTIARAVAEGHRVVVVVATLGEAGLSADAKGEPGQTLGQVRSEELDAATEQLGAVGWRWLGYADSGRFGAASRVGDGPVPFVAAGIDEAAERLARILVDEGADVVTTYDAAGGYGHPDHVRVHEVGLRAADIAATPVVLQATGDRGRAMRAARALRLIPGLPDELRPSAVAAAFVDRDQLTHAADVSQYVDRKRAAMRAHRSQRSGGSGVRSLSFYLLLPRWLFGRAFGTEWFVEVGREPTNPLLDDVFASIRQSELGATRSPCATAEFEATVVPGLTPSQVAR